MEKIETYLFRASALIIITVVLMFTFGLIDVYDRAELPVWAEQNGNIPSSPDENALVVEPSAGGDEIVEPEPIQPVEPEIKYYDVPLSEELQEHIIKQCEDRGIDPSLVLAMIKQESNFRVEAMGDNGNAYGLMQIWPKWHSHRMEQYGCTDLRDPFQNVTVGIDIIADYIDRGYGVEWALMAYNGGGAYADKKLAAGEVSDYAQKVLEYAEGYGYEG